MLPKTAQSLNSNHLCHLAQRKKSLHIFPTDWLKANKAQKDCSFSERKSEAQHFVGVGRRTACLPASAIRCVVLNTGQATLPPPGNWGPATWFHRGRDTAQWIQTSQGNIGCVTPKWNTYWWQLSRPRGGSLRSDSERRHWPYTQPWAAGLQ